jgi:predicted alpha/beta hydrolase
LYANAPIEYRRIAPRDIGVPRIGHFGFFRPQFEPTLWPLVPQWLVIPRDSPQSP